VARGEHRKRDGRDHEHDGCPGSGLRQHGCGGTSSESSLAAHASEGGGNVSTLPALQQHNDDQEQTNNNVNDSNQDNHVILNPRIWRPQVYAEPRQYRQFVTRTMPSPRASIEWYHPLCPLVKPGMYPVPRSASGKLTKVDETHASSSRCSVLERRRGRRITIFCFLRNRIARFRVPQCQH
jgi:hypothetical protein